MASSFSLAYAAAPGATSGKGDWDNQATKEKGTKSVKPKRSDFTTMLKKRLRLDRDDERTAPPERNMIGCAALQSGRSDPQHGLGCKDHASFLYYRGMKRCR